MKRGVTIKKGIFMKNVTKDDLIYRLKMDQIFYGKELAKLATISEPSAYSQHLQDYLFACFDRVTIRLANLL